MAELNVIRPNKSKYVKNNHILISESSDLQSLFIPLLVIMSTHLFQTRSPSLSYQTPICAVGIIYKKILLYNLCSSRSSTSRNN